MLPPFQLEQTITRIIREEWGRILAILVNATGNLQLAEDVLQDAVETALTHWQENGLPESPAAWLLQTSKRRAIDRFRRDSHFAKLQPEISYLQDLGNDQTAESDMEIPDKRLELIFTCCHPALDNKTRIALTLRTLGGLTTDEIARTFLDAPSTMAQRLVRAKKKISDAGIPYEIPDPSQLQQRLSTVLSVIYFIFNEGYSASQGEALTREDLSNEAIRLARITHQLLPQQCEVAGLLSLMLLHDSRRYARLGDDGSFISLENQNRRQWDKQKILEGKTLLQQTLVKQQVGPYQLQAAISAVHADAATWNDTDWQQITALYELLFAVQPSPVVRVNQSIAVSYAHTPKDALKLLDTIADEKNMQRYQPYYAARADILQRAGETEQAATFFGQAIALSENDAEREHLEQRLKTLSSLH